MSCTRRHSIAPCGAARASTGSAARPLRAAAALAAAMVLGLGPAHPGHAATAVTVEALGPAPGSVPEIFTAVLMDSGVRVRMDGEAVLDIWLRAAYPLLDDAGAGRGVRYGRIIPGMMIGVVTAATPWRDYRGGTLPPGTYTLRYAVQPADGNHRGVSRYRDFLIPLRFEDDPGPDELMDVKPLSEAGKRVTGTDHHSVMALYPDSDENADRPGVSRNELGHDTVLTRAGPLPVTLVVDGYEMPEGF